MVSVRFMLNYYWWWFQSTLLLVSDIRKEYRSSLARNNKTHICIAYMFNGVTLWYSYVFLFYFVDAFLRRNTHTDPASLGVILSALRKTPKLTHFIYFWLVIYATHNDISLTRRRQALRREESGQKATFTRRFLADFSTGKEAIKS